VDLCRDGLDLGIIEMSVSDDGINELVLGEVVDAFSSFLDAKSNSQKGILGLQCSGPSHSTWG
jgi:hypothetical protein